jgi:trypsin-like peptidase
VSIEGLEELIGHVRSGVVQLIVHRGKERLRSGTGFFVSQKLIAPHSIALEIPEDARLAVRFDDTPPAQADYSFSPDQIREAICGSSDEKGDNYAILNLPDLLERNPFQFKLAEHDAKTGRSVAFLGFHVQHWSLACHSTTISAIYPKGDARILQLDLGVNAGSIGGPLVDDTGEVLGIVARGPFALTEAVDNLLASIDKTISILSGVNFFASTSHAMASVQEEIKEVARQIQRSSTAGVGLAIACDRIKTESTWNSETIVQRSAV